MLTGSELRIGNYVFLKSKSKYYEILSGQEIDTGLDSQDFEPIPLTEEWLLNFGAKKTDKNDSFGGFIVYYPNGNGMRIKDNEWNSQHITVNVKYVHQLQNLYFSLTGKELLCEV